MKAKIVLIVSITLSLAACKPMYIKLGSAEIEKERALLEGFRIDLQSIDTIEMRKVYSNYMMKIDSLSKYYDDSREGNTWEIMTRFGNIKRPIKAMLAEYPGFVYGLSFSLAQLDNLEYDLRKKRITEALYQRFILEERAANAKMFDRFVFLKNESTQEMIRYKELSGSIDSLIIIFQARYHP